jgi:hypothetical protein
VRPPISGVSQFLHQRAFGTTERSAEYVIPPLPHKLEKCNNVPIGKWLNAYRSVVSQVPTSNLIRLGLVLAIELAFDERCQPSTEQIHCLADTFLIGNCHGLFLGQFQLCALLFLEFATLMG